MQIIKSCGAVVFTRNEDEIRYILIRSIGNDCGFPKGHAEAGEDEQTTALREIREEVGLSPSFVDGFRAEVEYPFPKHPDVIKRVVYFLAEYSDQEIHRQIEEVAEVFLVSYEEAMELLTFVETKNVLAQAERFLHR